ncbi:flagellar biosynthesis anti-sigma factor FlgM, partial [Streptomyces sp. NPDC093097]|uniref:flagellar biosynthesis anti-sigma factor FlgM n=1 Tax=Streptomyces sp. NPDC093097 TaxID=3366027 RepID=UPI00381D27F0
MAMVLTIGSGASAGAPARTGSVPAVAGQPAAAVQVASNDKAAQNFKDALQQFRKEHSAAPANVRADAVARVKNQIASGQLVT